LLLAEGGDGTQGRVTSVEDHHPSYRSCVKIEWKAGRTDYIRYHRGYKGSVDIKCVTAADGEMYYKDHLPKPGNYERVSVIWNQNNIRRNTPGVTMFQDNIQSPNIYTMCVR